MTPVYEYLDDAHLCYDRLVRVRLKLPQHG
jgi:hypothetical protein